MAFEVITKHFNESTHTLKKIRYELPTLTLVKCLVGERLKNPFEYEIYIDGHRIRSKAELAAFSKGIELARREIKV